MAQTSIMAFRSEDKTGLSSKLLSLSEARALVCLKTCMGSLFLEKKIPLEVSVHPETIILLLHIAVVTYFLYCISPSRGCVVMV